MAFRHALCALVLSCIVVAPATAQVQGGVDEVVRELGFALELPVSKSVRLRAPCCMSPRSVSRKRNSSL